MENQSPFGSAFRTGCDCNAQCNTFTPTSHLWTHCSPGNYAENFASQTQDNTTPMFYQSSQISVSPFSQHNFPGASPTQTPWQVSPIPSPSIHIPTPEAMSPVQPIQHNPAQNEQGDGNGSQILLPMQFQPDMDFDHVRSEMNNFIDAFTRISNLLIAEPIQRSMILSRIESMHIAFENAVGEYQSSLRIQTHTLQEFDQACPLTQYFAWGSPSSSNSICSIWQEIMVDGVQVRYLHCTHVFHGECIDGWFTHRNDCPLCRNSIL